MTKNIINDLTQAYPEWKKVVWRWVRTSLASAISIVLLLNPDWSKPDEALKVILTSFFAGFITSMAMAIRDDLGKPDKSDFISKMPL